MRCSRKRASPYQTKPTKIIRRPSSRLSPLSSMHHPATALQCQRFRCGCRHPSQCGPGPPGPSVLSLSHLPFFLSGFPGFSGLLGLFAGSSAGGLAGAGGPMPAGWGLGAGELEGFGALEGSSPSAEPSAVAACFAASGAPPCGVFASLATLSLAVTVAVFPGITSIPPITPTALTA